MPASLRYMRSHRSRCAALSSDVLHFEGLVDVLYTYTYIWVLPTHACISPEVVAPASSLLPSPLLDTSCVFLTVITCVFKAPGGL